MKKSTNFSAEKGRRLKIFATIFAAIFALIALATGLALKNYGGRRTDLTQTNAAATAPTDTSKYWTDEAAWSAADKDFNNYTLSGSGSQEDPYLIQNEWDLAYLSWTIYTNNPIEEGHVVISGSYNYFYRGIYFEQTADLDLSAYYWQPIGTTELRDGTSASRYFSGCYDGGSHTVAGVFTLAGTSTSKYYGGQGLFGYVRGYQQFTYVVVATISNVGVIDSFVQGHDYVGGVVGDAENATITNCYNTGSVSGSFRFVGGVVGDADYDYAVINCYNTGTVSGPEYYVGGVVGVGSATNCYNTGSVSGEESVGGVVGIGSATNCYNTGLVEGSNNNVGGVVGNSNGDTVINCYNSGSVSGEEYIGGVLGYAQSASTVENCYNTGSVSGSGSRVGGVVGWVYSRGIISNTYYGGDCTLSKGIGEGSGSAVKIDKPVEEWAKNKEWYSADALNSYGFPVWSADSPWDFENVWEFVSIEAPNYVTNNGYPKLKVFSSQVVYWTDEAAWSAADKDFNNYTLSGSGGQDDPYLIQSEWDLAYLSWTIYTNNPIEEGHVVISGSYNYFYSGIYFEQTADLDLSAYYWQPIGIVFLRDGTSAIRYFSGCYDGGNHTVSGVFTPAGEGDGYSFQGLFGYVKGQSSTNLATISNVGVIDSFVQGYSDVGGVVGDASSITVINCYNTGSVNASSNYVGGVVGYINNSSTITNCYNTGSVSGSMYVGGVVGRAASSTIENCYNTGSVSGLGYVGGVAGHAYSFGSSSCKITNCYNTGSVSGSDYAGGVLGYADSGSTIKNCFNTGSVSGSSSYVGGVVGYANSGSTVSNTYYGGNCTLSKGIGNGSDSAVKIDKPVEEWAKKQDWYSADAVNSDGSPVWSADSPWDFENTWKIVRAPDYIPTNDGYPVLQSFVVDFSQVIYWTDEAAWSAADKDFNNYTLSGSGSPGDPYLIQNEWDLAYLSWTIYTKNPIEASHVSSSQYYYSGIYFEQTADLDLSAYYWQPIGIGYLRDGTSARRYFSGCYDGGGSTVSGVFTPAGIGDGYSYQGLFGEVGGRSSTSLAIISNVGVIDSFVQGDSYVGGVVGFVYDFSSVDNCYNTGFIKGTGVFGSAGGVAGYVGNQKNSVENCCNTGIVEGVIYVGGVIGNGRGVITNCYNTGSVSGSSKVGGVVGLFNDSIFGDGDIVENCYNTGSVSGEEYVGGIVGYASNSAAVTNCGFEGVINGSSSIGAIVGDISHASAAISNCYAVAESDSEISLVGSNSGNGTIENIVGVVICGGQVSRMYKGDDFTAFAWLNFDSSPVLEHFTWAGQFQEPPAEYAGNSNWILTKMQSEGWSAI